MSEQQARQTAASRRVRIRIDSRADGQLTIQEAVGDWYARGNHFYIRYAEPEAQSGRTTTTVKLEPNGLKLIRHGDIRSEQSFVPGERRNGYYEAHGARLLLTTRTLRWEPQLEQGIGSLLWSYELEIDGQPAHTCRIKMTIEEIQEDNQP